MPMNTEDQDREYKLKAAFLLNFSKFITWPQESFPDSSQSFDFCIVGKSPFGTALDGLESKTIKGRQVKLFYSDSISEAKTCHMMFISKSEQNNLDQLEQTIGQQPTITVSDIYEFSNNGGIIEFITKDERLSFIINNQQAIQNKLQISASLLNLAAEVL